MPAETLEKLLEDCLELGVQEIVFSGDGEPLLYKGLPDIITRFGGKLSIRLLTNGSMLDMVGEDIFAKIDKLTISLNATSPETHRLIHGYRGNQNQYLKIKANVERLLLLPDAREKVQINYVLCKYNIHEFETLMELAQSWGIYFAIRPMVPPFKDAETQALSLTDIMNIKEILSQHKKNNLSPHMSRTIKQAEGACNIAINRTNHHDALRPCYFGFYWGNVWSNGNYSMCTYGNTLLGNIIGQSFADIWKSVSTRAAMYTAARMDISGVFVCGNCKGCMGPQLQSAAFHRIYSAIPFSMRMLKYWADKYAHSPH
jgi:MoaA/NifB/PqqE/SkfB family radical SAM enzyme